MVDEVLPNSSHEADQGHQDGVSSGAGTVTALAGFLVGGSIFAIFTSPAVQEDDAVGATGAEEYIPTESAVVADPLNWQPLLTAGTVLLALVVLIIVGRMTWNGVQSFRTRRLRAQESTQSFAAQWEAVNTRYQNTLSTITSYETDFNLAIQYPAMNDLREPTTVAMWESVQTVKDLVTAYEYQEGTTSMILLEQFRDAVNTLSITAERAMAHAKHVELRNMSETDRKDFAQAQQLLDQVSDAGNPETLRASYAEQLKKVIQRINDRHTVAIIPAKTVVELEQQFRLQIPAYIA